MDNNNKNDEILIQVTCNFSIDNQRNGCFDLLNDSKLENFNNQLLFNDDDSNDKIFHETIHELNLSKLYLEGYDVTVMKYGKKNIFYENEEDPDKTDESASSSSNESDDSENERGFHGGVVQKFIRTIFEDLVSAKEVNYIFSIGWTESNENNQLLDLLNGNGLIQCYSMPQLMETLTVGLSNRNTVNNHNILSIVLEQQYINQASGQPQHKLSTVNFCDYNYGTDQATNHFTSEPRDLPINFYNTQAPPQLPPYAYMMPSLNGNYFSPPPVPPEFGFFNNLRSHIDPSLAIAQVQNSKLLKNAEILFSKMNLNEMNDAQRNEIQEWMFLKSECDNFIPSSVIPAELPPSYFGSVNPVVAPQALPLTAQQPSSLLPIIEMDETNDIDEDDGNESECGSYIDINDQSNNLFQKISEKMANFREQTDEVVRQKSSDYFDNNPKVMSSGQSDAKLSVDQKEVVADAIDLKLSANTSMSGQEYLEKSGRRRSIRDNNVLNSDELNQIRKAAVFNSLDNDLVKENTEDEQKTKLEERRKDLKKSAASIEAISHQIKEVEKTIAAKKNLITDLIKNSKTRKNAKLKCRKKELKYQTDQEKVKKELSKATLAGKSSKEIQRLKDELKKIGEKLLDLTNVNEIAAESSLKSLHRSLEQSERQLEEFHKDMKKEIKNRDSKEKEVSKLTKIMESEANENNDSNKKIVAESASPSSVTGSKISDSKLKLRDINARISHLDEMLKKKSSNLQGKEQEALRCEIRNLRRTRETVDTQRVALHQKLKRDKTLSCHEERKMLEWDEAIMAIDDAIEVKNELICGHKSIDTDARLMREKGEKLLMERLNKMTEYELRVMIYKYFMKVIDLKESSSNLEQQVKSLERDKEKWEWREKILTNAIQQARLESERNLVIQQKNNETRIHMLLRHFTNETVNSSVNESNFDTTSTSGAAALPDYEQLNIVKASKSARHQYHQQAQLHHQSDIDRDFTRFSHVYTRIHQQGPSSGAVPLNDKKAIMIPHENIKQLTKKESATKVTREKNKLIIQKKDNK